MKQHTIQGKKRNLIGRKVKQLRAQGNIPGTVYGKKESSMSVMVATSDFQRVFKEAGETGLVELVVDGLTHPVLIHNVQRDPVSNAVLHIEFYQVDLKEKVKTKVPLFVVGESPAVSERKGVILSLLTEIEVEALPTDLPEKIDVDVSGLTDIDWEVKVSQLHAPSGVSILTDQTVGVVKVAALVSKEAEAQAEADAQAQAAKAESSAPAEGEAAAPAAEAKTEEKAPESSTTQQK